MHGAFLVYSHAAGLDQPWRRTRRLPLASCTRASQEPITGQHAPYSRRQLRWFHWIPAPPSPPICPAKVPDDEEPLWHQEHSVLDALRRPETASKEDPDSPPCSDTQRSLSRCGELVVHVLRSKLYLQLVQGPAGIKDGAADGDG